MTHKKDTIVKGIYVYPDRKYVYRNVYQKVYKTEFVYKAKAPTTTCGGFLRSGREPNIYFHS